MPSENNMQIDELIKQAARHYSITEDGEFSRDSTPYIMDSRAKMGVGFEYVDAHGYKGFNYRTMPSAQPKQIKSHRMIFYLVNGHLPSEIDHIDGDKSNNHPANLRAATRSQNSANKLSHQGSSSKYLGVHWIASTSKWRARISKDGKSKCLGLFTDEKEAAKAYNKAAPEMHGEFANLNKI